MRVKTSGLLRSVIRLVLPVALRRIIWSAVAQDYFDRSSIKKAVSHVSDRGEGLQDDVERLIAILKEGGFKPDLEKIKTALGLTFKAYSYQDLIAYLYFNGKQSGFFIDIGAYDGVEISNTFALESTGWNGICAEPVPEIFALLRKNRSCQLCNAAISSRPGDSAKFIKAPHHEGLSGLDQQMPERIKKGLAEQGLELEEISVKTMTFEEMMSGQSITEVDFLSVDVEGGEIDVLDSIDFDKYSFALITIENNSGTGALTRYLARHGYVPFLDLGIDLMFVRDAEIH